MTLVASMWNGSVGEVYFYVLIYMLRFFMYCDYMHSLHSAHIFIVVIQSYYFIMVILYKLYSPFCVQSTEPVCLYTLDIGL